MVNFTVNALVTAESDNKFFMAFERTEDEGHGKSCVCFHEFDKNSPTIYEKDIFAEAKETFPSNDYGGGKVKKIWLYTNKSGSMVTIVIVTEPENGKVTMLTASKQDGANDNKFTRCDPHGQLPQYETKEIDFLGGFYYNNGNKNKFFTFVSKGKGCGAGQGH